MTDTQVPLWGRRETLLGSLMAGTGMALPVEAAEAAVAARGQWQGQGRGTSSTPRNAIARTQPAFIGNIYGPLTTVTVPADAPPLFAALAADDPLFANNGFGLIEAWRAAKRQTEFHLYERGGHGFGMYQKSTTSTGWFDAFVRWMDMHGLLKVAR